MLPRMGVTMHAPLLAWVTDDTLGLANIGARLLQPRELPHGMAWNPPHGAFDGSMATRPVRPACFGAGGEHSW